VISGVGKHYVGRVGAVGPVGRPTKSLSASFFKLPALRVGYGQEYGLVLFQKNARLVGRLGSGFRLVVDRADVVFSHAQ